MIFLIFTRLYSGLPLVAELLLRPAGQLKINSPDPGCESDRASAATRMEATSARHLYPTWTQASVAWFDGLIAGGKSGAFTLYDIGGSWNVTPVMLPVSFNLYSASESPRVNPNAAVIPERSIFALAGFGLMAFMREQGGNTAK